MSASRAFTVIVREVVEFRVTVDPDHPDWAPYLGPVDDWVADLDSCASETEGPVERAVRAPDSNVIGAWREVFYDEDAPESQGSCPECSPTHARGTPCARDLETPPSPDRPACSDSRGHAWQGTTSKGWVCRNCPVTAPASADPEAGR